MKEFRILTNAGWISVTARTVAEAKKLLAADGHRILRQPVIKAKQVGGDDGYQYAVFIDGREFVNGLTRREVLYYVRQAQDAYLRRLAAR